MSGLTEIVATIPGANRKDGLRLELKANTNSSAFYRDVWLTITHSDGSEKSICVKLSELAQLVRAGGVE